MRTYTVHPHMTPRRLAYLRAVEKNAPYEPRHGVCANHCLALGWVDTVIRTADGELIGYDDLPPGDDRWVALQHCSVVGQRLTDKGREQLRKAQPK